MVKFLKLKLENFKPYYSGGKTKAPEIILFDEDNKSGNLTINLGPTGHGKTSINHAIMWCLYGENYHAKWDVWVNTLAARIHSIIPSDKKVVVRVELSIKVKNKYYTITRTGRVKDIEIVTDKDGTNRRKIDIENSNLLIRQEINALTEPEVNEFMQETFPPLHLMEYFIFDADDLMKSFESDRQGVIKDQIDRLMGVGNIDKLIEVLSKIRRSLRTDLVKVQDKVKDSKILTRKTKLLGEIAIQEKALEATEGEISEWESKLKDIFPESGGSLSPEMEHVIELIKKKETIEVQIEQLNKSFLESPLIANIDYLFLHEVLLRFEEKNKNLEVARDEFDSSLEIIKKAFGIKFNSLSFYEGGQVKYSSEQIISSKATADISDLNISDEVSGNMRDTIRLANEGLDFNNKNLETFLDFKKNLAEFQRQLIETNSEIKNTGLESKQDELKSKVEEYSRLNRAMEKKRERLESLESLKTENERALRKVVKKINAMSKDQGKIDDIDNAINFAENLIKIMENVKEEYLSEVLEKVNNSASKFLVNVTTDPERYNKIRIDANYEVKILTKDNYVLSWDEEEINKGNAQISLLSFFVGVSEYIDKKIPFVMDNPLMRLDEDFERGLITELCKRSHQVIFHLIPSKEYRSDNFKEVIKPKLNTQNFIHRRSGKGWENIPEKIAEVDKFSNTDIIPWRELGPRKV